MNMEIWGDSQENSKHMKPRHPASLKISGVHRSLQPIHRFFRGSQLKKVWEWPAPWKQQPGAGVACSGSHRGGPEPASPDITPPHPPQKSSAASPGNGHVASTWMLLVTVSSSPHKATFLLLATVEISRLVPQSTWILPPLGGGLTPSLSSLPGSPSATRLRS